MRKYIEEQLKKCAFANLDNLTENSTNIIIPKYSKPKYDIGSCYLIKFSASVLNNPNSVVASNWNAGSYPTDQYMKVFVTKMKAKMIYIECLAYDFENKCDLTNRWSGWVSIDDITQLAKLN